MNRRRMSTLALWVGCALAVTACGQTPARPATTAAPTAVDVSALAPRAGYGVYDIRDGSCRMLSGTGLSDPVPVASVFKLWVLDAVARSVAGGHLRWDTMVSVRDELRSDPSGEVFGYPTGRQVPVSRLAELMISISDNTAADHLIDLVGRDAMSVVIRDVAPDGASRTLPLLSTADMSRLKFVHPNLGAEYVELSLGERAAFLRTLPERGPFPWPQDPGAMSRLDLTTPSFVDEIEWFASGHDICRTMVDLARLSRIGGLERLDTILSQQPGLPPGMADAWTTTWFKGGSEPGVVALAYRLAGTDRDRVVVIALSDPTAPLAQRPDGQSTIEGILEVAERS